MSVKRPKSEEEHYVNNKEFLKAMKDFRRSCNKAKREKLPNPPISDYIGECIMKIANKIANKHNFINYPFKEEMISDGIENCIQYIKNFNPNKSKNPFSYFSTIIHFAFLRRIEKEQKNLYAKYKAIENVMTSDFYDSNQEYLDVLQAPTEYCNEHAHEYMNDFVKKFENKMKVKKEKAQKSKPQKKKSTLEEFLE